MPRLHGYLYYAFVAPGFVHPMGYKVEVVGEREVDYDLAAQRQVRFADATLLDTTQCAAFAHSHALRAAGAASTAADGSGMAFGLALENCKRRVQEDSGLVESDCAARHRRAQANTRTAERTVLVRIHIPVDVTPRS